MTDHRFTATLLRASADGIAGVAASRLLEADPAFTCDGFDAWRGHLRAQLGELAAAVEDQAPELFAQRVAWSREAFVARSVPVAALTASVARLREVVEESLPPEACSPLSEYFDRAAQELAREGAAPVSEIGGPHEKPTRAYVQALTDGDDRAALAIIADAMSTGLSARDALEGVLVPAQREIGRLWHAGKVNVAEEHFATATTRRALERALLSAPEPVSNGRSVLVAAVAGDAHDLGAYFVAAFFQLDGWRSLCLGADVPADDLVQAVERFDVDVVALGATLGAQRESATEAIVALKRARAGRLVIVGGPAFAGPDGLWKRVGADGFAATPSAAVAEAHRLLGM